MTSIPVIDFQHCSLDLKEVNKDGMKTVGKELFDAFSTIGFAYLKNSGVSWASVNEVHEITRVFFEQSLEEKLKFKRNPDTNFGYVGLCAERVDPDKPGDFKEAFDMSSDNAFANYTEWPDHLSPGFSNIAKGFLVQCKDLGLRILKALSYGMQLEEGHGLTECHKLILKKGNRTALRSLYYPAIPKQFKFDKGQLRLGEHSDYGTITLLFQDDIGGLQVQNIHGEFIEAVPIPDTVLINIGDVLQYQTCGELKSTIHRIRMPNNETELQSVRRSLVCFIHADEDTVINKPLVYEAGLKKKFTHDETEPPITAVEHTMRKWGNSY